MEIQELIIGPIYFIVILLVAYAVRGVAGDATMQKHFLRGLFLKLVGSIFVYIVYFFIYRGGDSATYYNNALLLNEALYNDIFIAIKLYYKDPKVYDFDTYLWFRSLNAEDTSSYFLVKVTSIFSIFCFYSYLGIAYLLSVLSFVGIWRMFKMFTTIYPQHIDKLALSFLYIPSVFFWGSGLLKDTITIGFLGFLVSSIYYIAITRKDIVWNIFLIILSVYMIGVLKGYILMAMIPAIILWIFITYRSKIKSKITKTLITPVLIMVIAVLGYLILNALGNTFQKFSLDNLEMKAKGMQTWHTYVVDVLNDGQGSSYSLGEVDYSVTGIIKKIPVAINVALFRPYIWEIRSSIMLLSAGESLVILFFTLSAIWYFFKHFYFALKFIGENPTIIFMLVFSLVFAFSVGFSSYNFGALSRYRIPLLPFYMAAIFIVRGELKQYDTYLEKKKYYLL